MDDILSFLNPQPAAPTAAAADPALKSQWDSVLQDPKTRGALLSFGLNLMNPTWGSPIANAMGAAAQSYAGSEDLERAEALRVQEGNVALGEKSADRDLRRELNSEDNAAAMARTRVAKEGGLDTKSQARWDRAYYFRQSKLAAANKAAQEWNDDLLNEGQPKRPIMSDEELLMEAERFADETVGKGPAGKGQGPSVTSGISAAPTEGGPSEGSAGSPPAAAPGASPTVASSPIDKLLAETPPEKLTELLKHPNIDAALAKLGVDKAELLQRLDQEKTRAAVPNFFKSLMPGAPAGSASRIPPPKPK